MEKIREALAAFEPMVPPHTMMELQHVVDRYEADVEYAERTGLPAKHDPTPAIVRAFIAELKRQFTELSQQAQAFPNDVAVVFYDCEGYRVGASFHKDYAEFYKLEATPHEDPPEGQPAVSYIITPPEGEVWR